MKDIELQLHEKKLRQMKDENTRVRVQARGDTNERVGEPKQSAGLVDEF